MKYEMGGVYTISVFGEVEANSEKEAKEKFEKIVHDAIYMDYDWIEEVSCDAKLVHDYKHKVEKAIYNSGFGYKVKETPTIVTELDIDKDHKIELYRAELKSGEYMFFLVFDEENVYIPFKSNCCLPCSVMNKDYDFAANGLFKVAWCNESNDYFTLTEYGDLKKICCGDNFTTLGMRLEEIKKHLSTEDRNNAVVSCCSDTGLTLVLTNNPKATIEAMYMTATDEVPSTLVKVEGLI